MKKTQDISTKKYVLITGASRGIGRSTLQRFIKEGFYVFGTYNSGKDEVKKLKALYGRKVIFLKCDFSKRSDIKRLLAKLRNYLFSTIVNNAGMFEIEDFKNFDMAIWFKTMQVNLNSVVEISIGLRDNIVSEGTIVNVSSTDGRIGSFGSMSYAASKSGIDSITKSLANNFGMRGIRVNAVAPGWINTGMSTQSSMGATSLTPLGRNGKPDEVANLIYFLTTKESSYINGSIITIDGGYSNVDYIMKREAECMISK